MKIENDTGEIGKFITNMYKSGKQKKLNKGIDKALVQNKKKKIEGILNQLERMQKDE